MALRLALAHTLRDHSLASKAATTGRLRKRAEKANSSVWANNLLRSSGRRANCATEPPRSDPHAITVEAFEAIASTLPLGSIGYENEINERGEKLIWLEDAVSAIGTRSDAQSRPFFYSLLGDGGMLGTAWIDRPVDTQDLHSLLPRPP